MSMNGEAPANNDKYHINYNEPTVPSLRQRVEFLEWVVMEILKGTSLETLFTRLMGDSPKGISAPKTNNL